MTDRAPPRFVAPIPLIGVRPGARAAPRAVRQPRRPVTPSATPQDAVSANGGASLHEAVSIAAVDAVRSMACVARAPPDLAYRAAQLVHVLFSRPSVRASMRASDAQCDDLLCCAAAALQLVAKTVTFLPLVSTQSCAALVHLLMTRRRLRIVADAAAAGTAPETLSSRFIIDAASDDDARALRRRITQWHEEILEANGFRVIGPVPHHVAVALATAIVLLLSRVADAAEAGDAADAGAVCSEAESDARMTSIMKTMVGDVVARCNDAMRSAALCAATQPEVVAAAAVYLQLRGPEWSAPLALLGWQSAGDDNDASAVMARCP